VTWTARRKAHIELSLQQSSHDRSLYFAIAPNDLSRDASLFSA
jgi:hypothetical protein